jgi:putative molybdopterin biosynthesis protein
MDDLKALTQFNVIKLLSDARRLQIVRLLMEKPRTLTHLAAELDSYPAKIRHHLLKLESAGLVELTSTQIVGGVVEKYYQATARAYWINLAVVPRPDSTIVLFGSHDPALEQIAQKMREKKGAPALLALPVGSLDGLIALRQQICQVAGAHLLDASGADYNTSYVRHIFPGQAITLLTLAHRQQGLLVAPGNPRQVRGLADLARPDIRLVNRQPGAGTRVWLEQALAKRGLSLEDVRQSKPVAVTHRQVAAAIVEGRADVGVGVLAAATAFDLDFIPLFEERYDLVLPEEATDRPLLRPLIDYLQTSSCRQTIGSLGGYETTHTGEARLGV